MENTKDIIKNCLYSGNFVGLHRHEPKKINDVIKTCVRFYDKWEKKGYDVDVMELIDGALQMWGVCKESKWEHAYQTLYQNLNENKVLYVR